MKLRIFWFLILLIAPAKSALSAESNLVLSSWLSTQTNIHTWAADVVQTRTFKTLTQPLVERGRVWFAEPDRFRWELGNPAKMIAVHSRSEMLLIYPMLKKVERYPLNADTPGPWREMMKLLEAGFPRSEAEITSRFRILSQKVTNDIGEVVLQPQSSAARKLMPQMQIGFDLKNSTLRSTELVLADGSRMRNDFKDPVLNPTVDENLFSPEIPSDFKVSEPLKQQR